MDSRLSRFRLHLRLVAATAVPSYADCVARAGRKGPRGNFMPPVDSTGMCRPLPTLAAAARP